MGLYENATGRRGKQEIERSSITKKKKKKYSSTGMKNVLRMKYGSVKARSRGQEYGTVCGAQWSH